MVEGKKSATDNLVVLGAKILRHFDFFFSRSVGRSVGYNFLRGCNVTPPCSYRSICIELSCPSFGRSAGWLVGWLVGRFVVIS